MAENENGKARDIQQAIQRLELRIASPENKATMADLIRLLQAEKELEPETPREIHIKWIDSLEETEPSSVS